MGGVWHVEGMKNESICSTAILYLDSDNISESRLNFRMSTCEPDYVQNDNAGVHALYGLDDGDGLVQTLGSISCKPKRAFVWPNVYQHRAAPFKLEDATKSASRKIVVFFLVDPSQKVLS